MGRPNVRGWYNTKTDVIRSGNYGEIPVIMHELGHYVDNYFGFSKDARFNTEFNGVIQDRSGNAYNKLGYGRYTRRRLRRIFKDYVSDRAKAKRNFQNFIATLRKQLRMNQN